LIISLKGYIGSGVHQYGGFLPGGTDIYVPQVQVSGTATSVVDEYLEILSVIRRGGAEDGQAVGGRDTRRRRGGIRLGAVGYGGRCRTRGHLDIAKSDIEACRRGSGIVVVAHPHLHRCGSYRLVDGG